MFYEEIPEKDTEESVELYRDEPNRDTGNYYSDIGDMSNYSFSSPRQESTPEKELLRYFLARGMRPQQAMMSTRAVMSGKSLRKTASIGDTIKKYTIGEDEPGWKARVGAGIVGAGLGAGSQAFRPASPRRLLLGTILGGAAGALTPGNPAAGLGLAGASYGLLRSANTGNLLRHLKMDKLKGVQEGLRDAAGLVRSTNLDAADVKRLNKAVSSGGFGTRAEVRDVLENFLKRVEGGGYSGADIVADAGNPRLTSVFSKILPSSMGGVRNVRLTAAPEPSGLGKLVASADDVAKTNISGLDTGNISDLRNILKDFNRSSKLNMPTKFSEGSSTHASRALEAALAIQKFNPAAAKEIVAASGQADRAAAHLLAPIMLGLGGSAVGAAAEGLFGVNNKAYGAVSGLQNASNYVTGSVPSNMADAMGITAARKHFNDNYGKYLLGGAVAAPLLYHMYRTPMREDLRTRGRI